MGLEIYGAEPRADNVTRAGPGVGKSARLMPYGSHSAGGIVSKVLVDTGKANGRVVRLKASD